MEKARDSNHPLGSVYQLLNASSPSEMSENYTKVDQEITLRDEWDYRNPVLVTNEVRQLLESIDSATLSDEERYWRANVLWFWYHHAITCAIWKYGDKEAASLYANKALEYQPDGHPNRITKLFELLLRSDYAAARQWLDAITTEPERTTGQRLYEMFGSGEVFAEAVKTN